MADIQYSLSKQNGNGNDTVNITVGEYTLYDYLTNTITIKGKQKTKIITIGQKNIARQVTFNGFVKSNLNFMTMLGPINLYLIDDKNNEYHLVELASGDSQIGANQTDSLFNYDSSGGTGDYYVKTGAKITKFKLVNNYNPSGRYFSFALNFGVNQEFQVELNFSRLTKNEIVSIPEGKQFIIPNWDSINLGGELNIFGA